MRWNNADGARYSRDVMVREGTEKDQARLRVQGLEGRGVGLRQSVRWMAMRGEADVAYLWIYR